MKTESSTPVDLVRVAIPKKKHPQRAAESRGKLYFLETLSLKSVNFTRGPLYN